MTKIRCGNNLGVNLDQVVAWKKGKIDRSGEKREFLSLYFAGADDALCVYQDSVGFQAFAHLHKLLLDRFAIDLAAGTDSLQSVDFVLDEPLKLSFETWRDERLSGSSAP